LDRAKESDQLAQEACRAAEQAKAVLVGAAGAPTTPMAHPGAAASEVSPPPDRFCISCAGGEAEVNDGTVSKMGDDYTESFKKNGFVALHGDSPADLEVSTSGGVGRKRAASASESPLLWQVAAKLFATSEEKARDELICSKVTNVSIAPKTNGPRIFHGCSVESVACGF
jgi:hypothetical protein